MLFSGLLPLTGGRGIIGIFGLKTLILALFGPIYWENFSVIFRFLDVWRFIWLYDMYNWWRGWGGGGMNIINVSPLHILGISIETFCGSHSFHTLPTLPFWNLLTPNKLTKFMKLGNMKPRCQRHCLTNHMITIHFSWRWRWIPRAGDHFSESSRNTSRPLPLLVRASQWGWGLANFPAVVFQQQGQGQGQWKSWRSAP